MPASPDLITATLYILKQNRKQFQPHVMSIQKPQVHM